jgi:hypothetical protein
MRVELFHPQINGTAPTPERPFACRPQVDKGIQ